MADIEKKKKKNKKRKTKYFSKDNISELFKNITINAIMSKRIFEEYKSGKISISALKDYLSSNGISIDGMDEQEIIKGYIKLMTVVQSKREFSKLPEEKKTEYDKDLRDNIKRRNDMYAKIRDDYKAIEGDEAKKKEHLDKMKMLSDEEKKAFLDKSPEHIAHYITTRLFPNVMTIPSAFDPDNKESVLPESLVVDKIEEEITGKIFKAGERAKIKEDEKGTIVDIHGRNLAVLSEDRSTFEIFPEIRTILPMTDDIIQIAVMQDMMS